MSKIAPTVELNDGTFMPLIALGTWAARDNEIYEAVATAIDVGYRHFDTAWAYSNEKEVGQAIRDKISAGVIKREDVYVVTKLWPTAFAPDQVIPACKNSLKELGLGYIDLYLLHWPFAMKYTKESDDNRLENLEGADLDYLPAYKGLEECVRLGLVKSIGISNFNSEQTDRVLSVAKIKPVCNQVECHIQLNQKKLIKFSRERDILITSYCPLARPDPVTKTPAFFFSEEMTKIAKKYYKTPAQVTLRYLIDIGTVPLPKSSNPARIKENFDIFDFELTEDEIKLLDKFNTGERINVPFEFIQNHKHYPFHMEF